MRWTAIPLSLIVFGLLYLFFGQSSKPVPLSADASALPDIKESTEATASTVNNKTPQTTIQSLEAPDCYSEAQIEMHPSILREIEYVDQVNIYAGYSMGYKGNSVDVLESLAEQGDSAAMAVLGAHYLLLAHDLDPDGAAEYLDMNSRLERTHPESEAHGRLVFPQKQDYTDEQLALLEKASYWFFESAVHGRYLALEAVGNISTRVVGNAVDHGWISETEYESLESRDRNNLFASNVYRFAGQMLLPADKDGVFIGLLQAFGVPSGPATEIATRIAASVTDAQQERGIVPVYVDISNILSYEELFELLCEEDKARILKEAGE